MVNIIGMKNIQKYLSRDIGWTHQPCYEIQLQSVCTASSKVVFQ